MGWVTLDPASEYMRVIAPVLEMKRMLRTDFWMHWLPATPVQSMLHSLAQHMEQVIDDPRIRPHEHERFLTQATLDVYAGTLLQQSYAECFKGMSENDIDRILQSFAFKQCVPNKGLLEIVKKHMQ